MPLNLNTSFKRRVPRKQSEKCRWKAHFTGCAREVIGALELLASNRQDRFVFAGAKAIAKMCHYRGDSDKPYSVRTVQDCLSLLRSAKILSDKIPVKLDGEDGPVRMARVLNPHAAMTVRHPQRCVFVGTGNGEGTWTADGIWQPLDGGKLFGLVVDGRSDGRTEGRNDGRNAGRSDGRSAGRNDRPKRRALGRALGCAHDLTELVDSEYDTQAQGEELPASSSRGTESEPLDPGESVKPGEPVEPLEPTGVQIGGDGDAYRHQGKVQTKGKGDTDSTSLSFHSLTNQRHEELKTVGQHFEGKNSSELICLATDGDVSIPSCEGVPQAKLARVTREISEYVAFAGYIATAAREYAGTVLSDRRVLAKILNRATVISGNAAPRPIFKTMKDFQEQGGEIMMVPPPPPPPPEKWSMDWLRSQDLTFREAWQKLESEAPREKLDEWYDRDAAPEKPPAPWRS
jgi:hypothetical protein